MSHDEVQGLKDWMASLSSDIKEIREQGAKTLQQVYVLQAKGCEKAAAHERVDADHEARLRLVETWIGETKGRIVGTVASISVAAGVLAWVADKAVTYVMAK